jgi:hypothetical protein
MIRQIAVIVILVFTVGAILTVAGPLMEGIAPVVENDDAVQEVGHDSAIDNIVTAVLVWAPLTLILGFIGWGFVWVLRRERRTGRV